MLVVGRGLLTKYGASLCAELSAVCAAGIQEVIVSGAWEGPDFTRLVQRLHEEKR